MEAFERVISILAFLSIGFSLAEVYLTVNQIWKRKHERAVAESISVTANLVSLIPGIIFALNYLLQGEVIGLIDTTLFGGLAIFYILVGMSIWVEGERKKGLWTLIKETLNLERQEAGDLARSLFKPSGANKVISILSQVAMIDEVLDDREKQFIQNFADNWNIKYSWDDIQNNRNAETSLNLIMLRQDVRDYLSTSPPHKQVAEFKDIINTLVNIDEEVSEQERLILGELEGLFSAYINQGSNPAQYHVIVVPQNDRQLQVVMNLPELSPYEVAEGTAYHSEPFYSKEYADIISEGYRSLNLFSIVTLTVPTEINVS